MNKDAEPTAVQPDLYPADPLLTYEMVAKLAEVKVGTVYMWRKRGLLPPPAPETTGRRPVWRQSAMDRWLEATGRKHVDLT